MSKDPAVLFYIDSWLVSTAEMEADCRGWYLNLLLHNYDKGSLPDDIEKLAVLCNVRFSEFERFKHVFEHVLKQKFELNENGRLANIKTTEILQKRNDFKESRSNAGKVSYIMRYFAKNYNEQYNNQNIKEFVKEKFDYSVDIKNEHVLKQVFKQMFELYINVNKNININKDKDKEGVGEKGKEEDEKQKSYRRFNEWIDTNIPYIRKIKNQITFEEYCRLTEKYNGDQIRKVLTDMSNYKESPKKYVSVNLTFQNWAKKEYGNG